MITARDIVGLPYTADLSRAGILFACRALPALQGPSGRRLYEAFRRIIAATIADLAFRRYLTARGVRFAVVRQAPFWEADRYTVRVAGRACVLRAYLISRRQQMEKFDELPELALDASALVPVERFAAENLRADDIYMFALVRGLFVEGNDEDGPVAADRWVHIMPRPWRLPRTSRPLGLLTLKSEDQKHCRVELKGNDGTGSQMSVTAELSPRARTTLDTDLHSVHCVLAPRRPEGKMGIHTSAIRATHVFERDEWQSMVLEGRDISLVGWITREQYRARANVLPLGSGVLQFDRTKTKNYAMPMRNLRPVEQLLDRLGGAARQ